MNEISVKIERAEIIPAIEETTKRALLYLGGAVRRAAKKSIRKGTKNNPQSNPPPPYGAIFSRSQIFKTTIALGYDEKTKSALVGPILFPGRRSTFVGKTLPEGLEYGGKRREPKNLFVPAFSVNQTWRQREANRRNTGGSKKNWTAKTVKTVMIPAGIHTQKPRPTMRLAFNRIATATNMQTAFSKIGIDQPQLKEI